jgi:hypothetical protein
MAKPLVIAPAPVAKYESPEELALMSEESERYRWLRAHAVRIQGSDVWYAGTALDIRIDIGREHMAEHAKDVTPPKPKARKRRQS